MVILQQKLENLLFRICTL